MRRRQLSDSELNQVIRLKQSGASWLKIQHDTGVPRRSAKRAYEDWQRDQSIAELRESRKDVATQAFLEHVDSLIKLAKFLASYLDVPKSTPLQRARVVEFATLWNSDILGEFGDYQLSRRLTEDAKRRESRRISRQYQMLFQSLQDHTREKIRWETLDELERIWDICRPLYSEVQKQVIEVVQNILNQEHGLLNKINKENLNPDAITWIGEQVPWMIWLRILDGKLDPQLAVVEVVPRPNGVTDVSLLGITNSTVLSFRDESLAERAADSCNWAAKNLLTGDRKNIVESLEDNIRAIRKKIEELAEMLNPLVLRPMILRTRCELCPA